jgi:hypothetical protein
MKWTAATKSELTEIIPSNANEKAGRLLLVNRRLAGTRK